RARCGDAPRRHHQIRFTPGVNAGALRMNPGSQWATRSPLRPGRVLPMMMPILVMSDSPVLVLVLVLLLVPVLVRWACR
ncbi:hypothetical protein, partial [Streptomyces sp. NPDC005141]